MKKIIAAILFAFAFNAQAAAPTDTEVEAYRTRMALYVSMGQTPEQIVASLRTYFGKPTFYLHDNGWDKTADVQFVMGDNTEIWFLATIGTLKLKESQ
jgi:hypothetical protein